MRTIGLALTVAVSIGAMIAGCGSKHGSGDGGGINDGGTTDGDAGPPGNDGGVTMPPDGDGGNNHCVGLECQQVQCPGTTTTTLTGKVYAPNGTLPLYNAIVYVPNGTPQPFTEGVVCDRCNGQVTGSPVVQTLTDSTGSFTLTNVPVGDKIPLVVQLGKWRRQVTVNVPACQTTPLDAGATRLPKNHSEGDIPMIAIATGDSDPLECLLLKLGVDASEITIPSGNGRIHFYEGETKAGTTMANAPSESTLFANLNQLLKYDVVLLPCEGTSNYSNTTSAQRDLLVKYLNAGGRVFATHYSYQWLTYANSPFNKISKSLNGKGLWDNQQSDYFDYTVTAPLNTSFPKGMAFAQWLVAAGVMSPMGQLAIVQGRHDITDVDPKYAQDWISYDFSMPPSGVDKVDSGNGVMHLTFNTPLDAPPDDMGVPQYCGRTVFSDFHVTADALVTKGGTFPDACKQAPMTDQEKALAFMLFDLSSCVQSDSIPPIP